MGLWFFPKRNILILKKKIIWPDKGEKKDFWLTTCKNKIT
jgi:hypothetical protein